MNIIRTKLCRKEELNLKLSSETNILRKTILKILPIFLLLTGGYSYFAYNQFLKNDGVVEFGTPLFILIAFMPPLIIMTSLIILVFLIISIVGLVVGWRKTNNEHYKNKIVQ